MKHRIALCLAVSLIATQAFAEHYLIEKKVVVTLRNAKDCAQVKDALFAKMDGIAARYQNTVSIQKDYTECSDSPVGKKARGTLTLTLPESDQLDTDGMGPM